MSTLPGWYGKLPGCGDFASRRLDTRWIARWDAWLAAGLLALRHHHPDDWQARYLAAPAWRFVLAPGALSGERAWRMGVLVPSVDRVGRCFPLTVASAPLPGPHAGAETLRHWERTVRSALQLHWPAAQFDTALCAAPWNDTPPAATDRAIEHGTGLWWHAGAAAPLRCAGLPAGASFEHLFSPGSPCDDLPVHA